MCISYGRLMTSNAIVSIDVYLNAGELQSYLTSFSTNNGLNFQGPRKEFLPESDGKTIKQPCVWTKLGEAVLNTMLKCPQKLFPPQNSNLGKSDLSAAKQGLTAEIRLVITRGSYTRKAKELIQNRRIVGVGDLYSALHYCSNQWDLLH